MKSKSLSGAKTKGHSTLGAPSQHNQGSRKGKRAWRKNVDIGEVEEGLEGLRVEERVTGTILQAKTDDELFQIDVKGDDHIRKALPRFSASQLTSTKILAQRSAVPAVFSRTSLPAKRKAGIHVSQEEKERLLRIGKRIRKGPLNSVMDPSEFGAGSAILEVSEAAKKSGGYDPWAGDDNDDDDVKDGLETVKKLKVKRPDLAHPRDLIEVPAITEPHQGTSYNPPLEAHIELILKAGEVEERRAKETEKLKEVKNKISSAITISGGDIQGVASGMTVDESAVDEAEGKDASGDNIPLAKKMPGRKTKQQKTKAARLRTEKRALAEKAAKKRMLATVGTAKAIRSEIRKTMAQREQVRVQRQLAQRDKLRQGLSGQRLGKHKVPDRDVDVQLGEDLSESLRALKPEGNLFRDRFQSLQQRALVEPRVPVLPTKRKFKFKEYEKHAWKRFE